LKPSALASVVIVFGTFCGVASLGCNAILVIDQPYTQQGTNDSGSSKLDWVPVEKESAGGRGSTRCFPTGYAYEDEPTNVRRFSAAARKAISKELPTGLDTCGSCSGSTDTFTLRVYAGSGEATDFKTTCGTLDSCAAPLFVSTSGDHLLFRDPPPGEINVLLDVQCGGTPN
jgi:hypothetical protein